MNGRATLHDRYALITGGGSGLGRELCRVFANAATKSPSSAFTAKHLDETLRIVESEGGSGRVEICDVTDVTAWQGTARTAAGRMAAARPARQQRRHVQQRLRRSPRSGGSRARDATELCSAQSTVATRFVPWLIDSANRSSSGSPPHVVNVSSIYGFLSPPGMSAYNMSKAGLVSLSETLRGELATHGVGVTVVCPGPMPTRFIESAHFESDAFRRPGGTRTCESSTLQAHEVALAVRSGGRTQPALLRDGDTRAVVLATQTLAAATRCCKVPSVAEQPRAARSLKPLVIARHALAAA